MLATSRLMGFIATTDPARARPFYEQVLGLTLVSEDQFATVFRAGVTVIRVARVQQFQPFSFTVLGWEVDDVAATARGLIEKGVCFERYEGFGQDELNVWTAPGGTKVAWFKDPDGNLLSISGS
jgi:catechol 2,3-dioxygenase-like lactoylglutathione lyase family enzyme